MSVQFVYWTRYGTGTVTVLRARPGRSVRERCAALLVHRDQYGDVFALISDRTRGLRIGGALSADDVGTGVNVGSMISSERFQHLQDTVEAAPPLNVKAHMSNSVVDAALTHS
jgi:hypothetical protein